MPTTWRTQDSTIASVLSSHDSTALVRGEREGAATLIATDVLDPTVKGAALVTVAR